MVIERFMAAAFGGTAKSVYAPEGLSWTVEIPAEHLLSDAGTQAPAPVRGAAS